MVPIILVVPYSSSSDIPLLLAGVSAAGISTGSAAGVDSSTAAGTGAGTGLGAGFFGAAFFFGAGF